MPHAGRAWWTTERVNCLVDLAWVKSARQMAELLGTTRNAVIGKCHRLGIQVRPRRDGRSDEKRFLQNYDAEKRRLRHLTHREHDLAKQREYYQRTRESPVAYRAYLDRRNVARRIWRQHNPAEVPVPLCLTFDQLTATACRWPTAGEGLSQVYCGHGIVPSRSYCPYHHLEAHNYRNERK